MSDFESSSSGSDPVRERFLSLYREVMARIEDASKPDDISEEDLELFHTFGDAANFLVSRDQIIVDAEHITRDAAEE